jgi:2,4-dienoyl-CoA reductase-like NADH-dependent reductase (Old Yellow Enzyme family)
MNFESTFKPMYIGKMLVKNRLVVPAMDSAMCEEDGTIGKMACDYYGSRAKGGFGLIITEIAAVDERAPGMPGQPRLYSDEYIPGLKSLAKAIHTGGAKAIVQLHHAGRETTSQMIGQTPTAPSSIPSVVYREKVNEYTTEQVYELIDSYIQSAVRCKIAGFDGIEFHSAHGYMGLQFLSPRTNKRIDEFGGGVAGRSYFHKLVIEGIRRECGEDFAIIVRLDSIEGRAGGIEEGEAVVFARLMESYGADAINVSAGTYASWEVIVPPTAWEEGWNWRICRRIKEAVNIPVMLAGRFTDPFIIEQSIERGDTDFVCLGRQSIADPEFPNKMAGGAIEDIVPCVGCTQRCMSFNDHDTLQEGDWGVSCIFNPMSNNRKDVQYTSTDNPKKVMVVGAGVAGLEAAWIAAERGHNVTLYEKNGENRVGAEAIVAVTSLVLTIGLVMLLFLSTSNFTVTLPATSTPDTPISPSPIAACKSPRANRAPSVNTGRYKTDPSLISLVSIFPPWDPGVPQFILPSSGATPITPIIGLTGKLIFSLKTTFSSLILRTLE